MMRQASAQNRPAAPGAWEMYRAMVGVGLVCGLLIVTVFEVTRPAIERNKAEALQQAILQVLPDAASSQSFRLNDDQGFERLEENPGDELLVHAGYDDQQRLVGLAIEAEGMGYQDVIRVIYGYSFEAEAVVGIRVLESKETPGLGDRIETDPAFLANFDRLDASLDDAGASIANPIVPVKHGHKQQPWEVDGITGATISSVAIANILARSTAYWIPRVRRGIADFEKAS